MVIIFSLFINKRFFFIIIFNLIIVSLEMFYTPSYYTIGKPENVIQAEKILSEEEKKKK